MYYRFPQKISILIITGLIFLLPGCRNQDRANHNSADTLFLENAYAQSDTVARREISRQLTLSRQTALTRAAAVSGPAVVGINVMQVKKYVKRSPFYTDDPLWQSLFPELFRDRIIEHKVQSLGSGFIISEDGYLVTNEHVVEDAEKIVITLPGGERHEAEFVGSDHISDIALLKIDAENFSYLKLGDSENLIVGEWVIALGNPFGLFELNDQPTVTVGVISAVNRNWGRDRESGRIYMDMIQTDAAINHGNSGGPLVNALGEVIGMNTFIFTGSRYQQGFVGIGFAIPVNRIKKIVGEIQNRGEVNRNYWLGFRVQDLDRFIRRAYHLEVDYGVIVTQVEPASSAQRAGLRPEDIILQVEGQKVESSQGLLTILSNIDLQVGEVLNMVILRNNKKRTIHVTLLQKPE